MEKVDKIKPCNERFFKLRQHIYHLIAVLGNACITFYFFVTYRVTDRKKSMR